MTGDDRLRGELESLERAAPSGLPPQRATSTRSPWFRLAAPATAMVFAGLIIGISLPGWLGGIRLSSPGPSTSQVAASSLGKATATPDPAEWEWTRRSIATGNAHVQHLEVFGARLIATGSADGMAAAWTSEDAVHWQRASIEPHPAEAVAPTRKLGPVYEVGDRLVAIGIPEVGRPVGYSSVDGGSTWHFEAGFSWDASADTWSGPGGYVSDVVVIESGYLATGTMQFGEWALYAPRIGLWTSVDGMRWAPVPTTPQEPRGTELGNLGGATWAGSRLYAFGNAPRDPDLSPYHPAVWESDDGLRWTEATSLPSEWEGVVISVTESVQMRAGVLLAAGLVSGSDGSGRGVIWTSHDGADWTRELVLDEPSELRSVVEFGDGTLLAVGSQENVVALWLRRGPGEWQKIPIESDRSWVDGRGFVEFRGTVLVYGNLPALDVDGVGMADEAVVWMGMPPSSPPISPASIQPTSSDSSPMPSARACATALATGVLHADEAGNPILLVEPGTPPVSIVFAYPEDFVIEASHPLTIHDRDGNVLATEGDYVTLGGGFGAGDTEFYACGVISSQPTNGSHVDCGLPPAECDLALSAAAPLLYDRDADRPNVVVTWGRGLRAWHAEVHACWDDGRYLLIDVIGPGGDEPPAFDDVSATIREKPWDDPPCD